MCGGQSNLVKCHILFNILAQNTLTLPGVSVVSSLVCIASVVKVLTHPPDRDIAQDIGLAFEPPLNKLSQT